MPETLRVLGVLVFALGIGCDGGGPAIPLHDEPATASGGGIAAGTETRERILAAAAVLFARNGFLSTSTRAIAAAVDIRQPSLFHHFPSKQAILAELLERDLRPAVARVRRFRAAGGGAAARLYAYLVADAAALVSSPFDARGLYNEEVLGAPEMVRQQTLRGELHDEVRALVTDGIASGEFRSVDPVFAERAVTGMMLDTIRVVGTGLAEDLEARPRQVADFVLLALLRAPESLESVRAEAAALGADAAFDG